MLAKHTTILLGFVATWIAGIEPAHAEGGLLVVRGGAAEHERAIVGAAIEGAIRNAGWSLSPSPLTKTETDDLLDCSHSSAPWSCMPASVGARGVRGLFVVSVESVQSEGRAPVVVITEKLIVTSPPSFIVRQRYCEHCADDRLGAAGEELTRQMVREFAARSGRTVIHITSAPTGAQVIIDGARVGATDATFNTFPATHVVIVQKPGFLPEARQVTIEEGKTSELSFALHPDEALPPPPPPPPQDAPSSAPRSPSLHIASSIAIGAGLPLAVFGGIAISRGLQDGPDDKYTYSRATAIGVTSELIGLGAIGAGLYLLWRDSNVAPSAPRVSVTSGGAVVGWAGSF